MERDWGETGKLEKVRQDGGVTGVSIISDRMSVKTEVLVVIPCRCVAAGRWHDCLLRSHLWTAVWRPHCDQSWHWPHAPSHGMLREMHSAASLPHRHQQLLKLLHNDIDDSVSKTLRYTLLPPPPLSPLPPSQLLVLFNSSLLQNYPRLSHVQGILDAIPVTQPTERKTVFKIIMVTKWQ